MSIEQFYLIECDGANCTSDENEATMIGKNRAKARQSLKLKGWSCDGYGRDFCPNCTARKQLETGESQ